ncbi:MAG: DUF4338 domain-containing protein [Proteobacteria bacterium]|nr:DUF4338 domain-containing protein [Pseudomonadota bacterium]
MKETIICQGREITVDDLNWLKTLIEENPSWSRNGLCKEICRHWEWSTATGQLKTFAARSLLLKLEQRGLVKLPPLRTSMIRPERKPGSGLKTIPDTHPIATSLADLQPLQIVVPGKGSQDNQLFEHYLLHHHYLGFNRTVGENIKYLIRDRFGRDLGCVLFGSSAWKTEDRDRFIGWSDSIRQRNVNFTTNNTRFLILPWVTVPHLASHVLGLILRRLKRDWVEKYGHAIYLVETFVDRSRFKGTCYKAANWIRIGKTKGRSRQDRYSRMKVPIKDIYLYPLTSHFKQKLSDPEAA